MLGLTQGTLQQHVVEAAGAHAVLVAASLGAQGQALTALATAHGFTAALHLTGRDRTLERGGAIAAVVPVYESAPIPIEETALRTLAGTTALLHSARAARWLREVVRQRHDDNG